jgi:orotidine-5'-phosphate decarboxylase
MQLGFADRLVAAILLKRTPLVVGLDPRVAQLPEPLKPAGQSLQKQAEAVEVFCRGVIDVVAPLVPAIKPQVAFFEQLGPAGMTALYNLIGHARKNGLLVIADGKRGDIGSTAEGYAQAWLGRGDHAAWGADALTVNPWLGRDSLEPFVKCVESEQAGLFVLVRTSNQGSRDYQAPLADGVAMFERVARDVEALANRTAGARGYGSVGAVVGATWPQELARLRELMPSTMFLVPGFGAQGGSAADVAQAFDNEGLGAIVNSSRGVIFGWEAAARRHLAGREWQKAVEQAAGEAIAQLRADTAAGKL